MSVTVIQSQAAFYDTGYSSCSHGMTNVSIPEVNMLKKWLNTCCICSLNLSTKLGFEVLGRVNILGH